ncbi:MULTISPECIES: ABC transporter ATP-binding protein [unclassified Brenneria]|uniref:ABC transporter ATP-binding protein n=1 Tax=unclassified Brenneria TaxID=2634434 RepID=UPI0018F09F79|nr:ABC transporter ATP-binding protein [Brenneria sp. L3-3C-1]MBJ7224150.1 ABC transporter ATP-binding protein [Brenneria sp. L3-3C-1]MEE3645396.1 ABC transporter ATP-binding protein [Brenneria sp. L3_3C_1]
MYRKFDVNEWFAEWIKPFEYDGTMPPNSTMRFIIHYLKRAKFPVILMLLFSGLVAGIEAGMFYFIGRIIDMMNNSPQGLTTLLKEYGNELIFMAIIILFARTLFSWILSLIQNLTFTLSFSMMVRWQVYSYVSQQGVDFFNKNHAGALENKVWESGGALGNLISTFIQTLWFIIIYALITVFLIGKTEPIIALFLIGWFATYCVIAVIFVPKIKVYSLQHSNSGAKAKGTIVDNFLNIITLKLFGATGQGTNFVRNSLNEYFLVAKKLSGHISNANNLITLLSSFMLAITTWFSLISWSEGTSTPGVVAFTMGLVLRLSSMLAGLLSQLNILMRHIGSLQSSVKLVAKPLILSDTHNAIELEVSQGGIVFENVSFGYGAGKNILNNLNLNIKPGEKVAIVGPSGAGKTTIFNLLLRLYDPKTGRIVIDGTDITKVTQVSLHNSVVAVTQDGGLLHRSVSDNLVLGREDINQSDIKSAIKLARADEFINNLEDDKGRTGLDAFVGERGVKLSGGQRQRISIARAMLKEASVYLFDEASSALDSESEAAIQKDILSKIEGKTIVMIAHRLSSITTMDRLIVLRKGEIVEQGTHEQLLEMNGTYSRLWKLQSVGYH